MGQSYVGEIRAIAFTYAPSGWMLCQGQVLQISQYQTLFTLLGTTYGGDGQQTFSLPDLRGRTPIHTGTGAGVTYPLGMVAGQENVTLNTNQIPTHYHPVVAQTGAGNSPSPTGAYLAQPSALYYSTVNSGFTAPVLSPNASALQPHPNLQPYLCLNYAISLYGVFPSQQ